MKFEEHKLWRELIEQKKLQYPQIDRDLSDLEVICHNATWCPDCEREVTELIAFLEMNQGHQAKFEIISYEDKEKYKAEKAAKSLEINCLPTIIIKRNGQEILKVEESIEPNLKDHLLKLIN